MSHGTERSGGAVHPQHGRKRGGQRHQKMDAVMEPSIWLGKAEESDEHLWLQHSVGCTAAARPEGCSQTKGPTKSS